MRNERCACIGGIKKADDIMKKDERITQISEQIKMADNQIIQLKELIKMLFNRLQPVLITTKNDESVSKIDAHPELVPLAQWIYEHNLNIKQACESIENIIQLMEI